MARVEGGTGRGARTGHVDAAWPFPPERVLETAPPHVFVVDKCNFSQSGLDRQGTLREHIGGTN